MGDARYDSLCRRINQMADWKATALCAVCASKVTPIIARLGLPDTWHLVEECLEFVWGHIGGNTNSKEALRLTEALEATPEWQCEDNSFLPFAVTKALDFVKLALLAVANPTSAKDNAGGAFDLLVGLASSYDFAAKSFPAHATTKKTALQSSEEESQGHLVSMLERATSPSSQTLADLRKEAERLGGLLKVLLPMYCYDYAKS
jgi:hypothetical protein